MSPSRLEDRVLDLVARWSFDARQRGAVTEFTTGSIAASDWLVSSAFFALAARRWATMQTADDRLHLLRTALAAVPAPPTAVVELGCGAGGSAIEVARTWPQATVHAYDAARPMIGEARRRTDEPRIRFERRSARKVDDTADLVLACNFAPYPGAVARILRPGGHALVVNSFNDVDHDGTSAVWRRHGFERVAGEQVESGSFALYVAAT